MTPRHFPFVGIDDFAFKKRFTYGTIFIDLQTHQPLDILNTRQPEGVTKWLKTYPAIKLITRDGSKTYAAAVKEASPAILQVADRWHLLHQLFEALKKTVFALLPATWTPPSPKQSTPPTEEVNLKLRKHERLRIQNQEKRWQRIQQVQSLYKEGYTKTEIHKRLNISFGTVRNDLSKTEKPKLRRTSAFQRFRPLIRSLIQEKRASSYIEEICRSEGYKGSVSTLTNMISEERKQLKQGRPATVSIRQEVLRVLWDTEKENHYDRFQKLHPNLLDTFPQIMKLDELVHSFRQLFKDKKVEHLLVWLKKEEQSNFSFIRTFVQGILQDLSAVKLSIEQPWSNGPTEGQVNRLKTIKRMMYGRAGFQVLRNRVLYRW